jgi:cation:H+ antiporter
MIVLQLIGGFLLLLLGAEVLVHGSVALARRMKVTPFLVGLTVVAYGTSAPELLVSLQAALRQAPDMAIGNVIGSNIANILLVLGVAAVIWRVDSDRRLLRRDLPALVLTGILFVVLAHQGQLVLWHGVLMLILVGALTIYAYFSERRHHSVTGKMYEKEGEEIGHIPRSVFLEAIFIIGGLAAITFGSEFLIKGSTALARLAGISEATIGLTLLAVGSSLPELATTIIAAYRRHSEVAFGNILGSCIFNILGIMGVVSMVTPMMVSPKFLQFDIWVMMGAMTLPFIITIARIPMKWPAGLILLGTYVAYVCLQFL